jgi:hypothetical protein
MPQAEVLWEIDWPGVFNDQGTVDLRAAGATITVDGVTMRNLAAADGDPNNPVAANVFETAAAGLDCQMSGAGTNSDWDANTPLGPALLVTLDDVATALGFDPDPTRTYIAQCFVPTVTRDTATNFVGSGCGWWSRPGDPAGTAQMIHLGIYGFNAGTNQPAMQSGDAAIPTVTGFADGTPADMHIVTAVAGPSLARAHVYAVEDPMPFDWPSMGSHRFIGAGRSGGVSPSPGSTSSLTDAFSRFLVVAFFQKPNNGVAAFINERFRLLRI